MSDPRLDIMRRYVEEYTNGHDLAVARQIMSPEYVFTMGGTSLDLEEYLEMVEQALERFTDLRIAVDEIVLSRDRLAMAFRETATSPRTGISATWRGVALYEFDDSGLLASANVEQDFWGRRARFREMGIPLDTGSTDNAVWQQSADEPLPAAAVIEAIGSLGEAEAEFDDGAEPWIIPESVAVTDLVSSHRRVAVQVGIRGSYRPTATSPDLDLQPGDAVHITATGVATLDQAGQIVDGRFITDRYGFWLRHRPELPS